MWRYITTEELCHYGVQGMKWGVRRYQNSDGTLTAAGKDRYGNLQTYERTKVRDRFTGRNEKTGLTKGEERISKLNKKLSLQKYRRDHTITGKETNEKTKARYDKEIEKTKVSIKAQKVANLNREAYDKHTSTGKLVAQDLLLGVGANHYRNARSRGESRGKAFVDAVFGDLTANYKTKKAYGATTHNY